MSVMCVVIVVNPIFFTHQSNDRTVSLCYSVFSTSKDHNQGNNAMAGCILIDFEKMQVINRSPAYRNQYVHRRDSVSLAMLSEAEIKERVQLGLIEGYHEEEEEEEDGEFVEEEWEEFDEDEMNTSREDFDSSLDDNHYVVDDRRKSSVEPSRTIASPPGSTHGRDFSVEDSDMPATKINFSAVNATGTRKKKAESRFGAISEENGEDEDDDDDEESTVDGEEEDNHSMEHFDDNEQGASTTMSPALKKFSL